ncbi:MAG: hypothetical protein Kow0067_11680 [Coriobacteriia bacterium]
MDATTLILLVLGWLFVQYVGPLATTYFFQWRDRVKARGETGTPVMHGHVPHGV